MRMSDLLVVVECKVRRSPRWVKSLGRLLAIKCEIGGHTGSDKMGNL
jgi:hypothetical protein